MKFLKIGKKESKIINNLFHPTSEYKLESFDEIIIKNCFNKKNYRFLPIFLKEVFALLKENGLLKFYYNSEADNFIPGEIENTFWWLFNRKYSIIKHDYENKRGYLIIKKDVSNENEKDSIDSWSFGIVTNGIRRDFIEKTISSIRQLKIPNYEIIICGNYPEHKGTDVKYIEFKDRDDKGWITRKKNIIAENSKYENICIFHDRIVFDKDWYKGMKKYGNFFELLTCSQYLEAEKRTVGDWITSNIPFTDPGCVYRIEEMDYRDWDRYTYISGQLVIIKKRVWEKESWNETFYWGEGEDIEYSHRLADSGFLPRFNSFSRCETLSWRFGKLPKRKYLDDKFDFAYFLSDVPVRRFFRFMLYYLNRFPFFKEFLNFAFPIISKTGLLTVVRSH